MPVRFVRGLPYLAFGQPCKVLVLFWTDLARENVRFVKEDDVLRRTHMSTDRSGYEDNYFCLHAGCWRVVDAYWVSAYHPSVHVPSTLVIESPYGRLRAYEKHHQAIARVTYDMQQFTPLNRTRWEPPYVPSVLLRAKHEIQIALSPAVEIFEIVFGVCFVHAGQRRVHLVAHAQLHELGGLVPVLRLDRPERRTERPALASPLLDVEAHLERRALLEVEVVREGVVQGAVDACLVGVEGALERRRRAREQRRPVQHHRRVQTRSARRCLGRIAPCKNSWNESH